MKKLALPMLALTLGLAACGQSAEPAAEGGGTVVEEGDEWTADAEPGAVDVKLPDTPVKMEQGETETESETDADDSKAAE